MSRNQILDLSLTVSPNLKLSNFAPLIYLGAKTAIPSGDARASTRTGSLQKAHDSSLLIFIQSSRKTLSVPRRALKSGSHPHYRSQRHSRTRSKDLGHPIRSRRQTSHHLMPRRLICMSLAPTFSSFSKAKNSQSSKSLMSRYQQKTK